MMRPSIHLRVFHLFRVPTRLLPHAVVVLSLYSGHALAQLPNVNLGPDPLAKVDFAVMYLDQQKRHAKDAEQRDVQNKKLIDSGVVSALDLAAPNKAVEQYNRATTLLRTQNSKEAIKLLQKAIQTYPKFVSAHNALGLAYLDQEDGRARDEFEAAAKLDNRFPGSFLNLGLLALSGKDFSTAQAQLEKAASLSPTNPQILSSLAFAQNKDHLYQQTLATVRRVHALEHKGLASVHYIGASAAMAINDPDTMEHELSLFLTEDPTNPLAPVARRNVDMLARRKQAGVQGLEAATPQQLADAHPPGTTFPNTERLRAELNAVTDDASGPRCQTCNTSAETNPVVENANPGLAADNSVSLSSVAAAAWTIHKAVDETALFFAVSSHGHMVSDLDISNIQLLDDSQPPEKVLQFIPQSKLPLRLALLVDTSGSVEDRFSFEKHAAAKFLQRVLNGASDLGFVGGFAGETTVTHDFAAEPAQLALGVEKLSNGGGTALFDAVSFACRKLAAYPEHERVARVLVVLSDGEDNSSHRSLKQSIEEAETTGVTIYTVSTKEGTGVKTDADKVLQVLAERSGGEAMFPGDMTTLTKSLDKLRDLIRSRYLLAYKAAGFEPNGKYRAIHITAKRDGKHLQVHARKGYYARVEIPQN